MGDLKNPRAIYFKGFLFLFSGIIATILLLLECPRPKVALLVGLAVWCFCRFYYFAFYVIQHYVDDNFRFSGLFAFFQYLLTKDSVERKDD